MYCNHPGTRTTIILQYSPQSKQGRFCQHIVRIWTVPIWIFFTYILFLRCLKFYMGQGWPRRFSHPQRAVSELARTSESQRERLENFNYYPFRHLFTRWVNFWHGKKKRALIPQFYREKRPANPPAKKAASFFLFSKSISKFSIRKQTQPAKKIITHSSNFPNFFLLHFLRFFLWKKKNNSRHFNPPK